MTLKVPLNDRRVQALLSKFMNSRFEAITPLFDLKSGIVYPEVEEILGVSGEAEDFLNMLYESGFLKRELYDKIICCPECGSANVSTVYCCPFCGSFDIKRSSLVEHIKCGYMDVEDKFHDKDRLICPKCKLELADLNVDFRKAGVWCTCNRCSKSFDIPAPRHFCRNCQANFTFEEAVFKNAYTYRLKEDFVKGVALDWAILPPIRKRLKEKGFNVETPGFVEGRSGVRHMFDLVAYNNGRKPEKIAINISTSTDGKPVQEQAIIDIFAKKFDSNIEKAVLIAMPEANENTRKLSKLYKIHLIEAKNLNEILEKISELQS